MPVCNNLCAKIGQKWPGFGGIKADAKKAFIFSDLVGLQGAIFRNCSFPITELALASAAPKRSAEGWDDSFWTRSESPGLAVRAAAWRTAVV